MNKELLDEYMGKIRNEKHNFEEKYEEEPAYIKVSYFGHYIMSKAHEENFGSSAPLKSVCGLEICPTIALNNLDIEVF